MKEEKELGFILVNSKGLRQLADTLDIIYSNNITIKLNVWQDKEPPLYFQLSEGSGEINCVKK